MLEVQLHNHNLILCKTSLQSWLLPFYCGRKKQKHQRFYTWDLMQLLSAWRLNRKYGAFVRIQDHWSKQ